MTWYIKVHESTLGSGDYAWAATDIPTAGETLLDFFEVDVAEPFDLSKGGWFVDPDEGDLPVGDTYGPYTGTITGSTYTYVISRDQLVTYYQLRLQERADAAIRSHLDAQRAGGGYDTYVHRQLIAEVRSVAGVPTPFLDAAAADAGQTIADYKAWFIGELASNGTDPVGQSIQATVLAAQASLNAATDIAGVEAAWAAIEGL
jgi:hypothetical protein